MKKSLFVVPFLLSLCSCFGGTSAQGVMGKTFTFASCTSETVKAGTSDAFYSENNRAGSSKDAVVSRVVKAIYAGDSSDSASFSDLTFSTQPGASNVTYNGKNITTYNYNYASLGEYSVTSAGYYMDLGNDWTSLHFLTMSTTSGGYEDMVYSLGGSAGSGTTSGSYSYKTTAKDTSIKYTAASKSLDITMDVTFVSTEDDSTTTSTITYVLNFQEK